MISNHENNLSEVNLIRTFVNTEPGSKFANELKQVITKMAREPLREKIQRWTQIYFDFQMF